MLKLLKVALCSALFVVGSNASDFLAKATSGVLSDNAMGIKQLNASEMEAIKGGYGLDIKWLANNEIAVIALPDFANEIGMGYDANGDIAFTHDYGLCEMGVTSCYYNEQTKTHLHLNKRRFEEYAKAFMGTYEPWLHGLAYTVKREIKVSDRGTRYPLFTYGVAAYNRATKNFHTINSSAVLNNNTIVKELRDVFKSRMENALGGWTVGQ